ncbi:MAG: hypothetical protein QM811_16000 [Pirellulales bacterium]
MNLETSPAFVDKPTAIKTRGVGLLFLFPEHYHGEENTREKKDQEGRKETFRRDAGERNEKLAGRKHKPSKERRKIAFEDGIDHLRRIVRGYESWLAEFQKNKGRETKNV